MRLIWTTENADHFRSFCTYLDAKNVRFITEEQLNKSWDSDQYGTRKYLLWIQDEDQLDQSITFLIKFLENPLSQEYQVLPANEPSAQSLSPVTQYLESRVHQSLELSEEKMELGGHVRLTTLILLFCSFLFLYELYIERQLGPPPPEARRAVLAVSPARKMLLFDYPHTYELVDKVVALYGYPALAKPQELPEAGKFLYQQHLKEAAFPGYYPYVAEWAKEKLNTEQRNPQTPLLEEISLFEKIRTGQIWRLWTPVLLHADILHIFFNMIWVLLLATQIESRLSVARFLLFLSITGCLSNTAQYLMSGPNFIGFSGIICAMATYIRARQKVAPWESYQMSSSTFAFIIFFISILAFLSMLTFVLDVFQNMAFPIGIANTAHLVGALTGYLLGRMQFFSWQLHK